VISDGYDLLKSNVEKYLEEFSKQNLTDQPQEAVTPEPLLRAIWLEDDLSLVQHTKKQLAKSRATFNVNIDHRSTEDYVKGFKQASLSKHRNTFIIIGDSYAVDVSINDVVSGFCSAQPTGEINVFVLSYENNIKKIRAFYQAGIRGYLLKDNSPNVNAKHIQRMAEFHQWVILPYNSFMSSV